MRGGGRGVNGVVGGGHLKGGGWGSRTQAAYPFLPTLAPVFLQPSQAAWAMTGTELTPGTPTPISFTLTPVSWPPPWQDLGCSGTSASGFEQALPCDDPGKKGAGGLIGTGY